MKSSAPPTLALGAFLRQSSAAILNRWEERARMIPRAETLPRPVLRDSMPELLERIATEAEATSAAGVPASTEGPARTHALQRLDLGFSQAEMVSEYALLRDAIWSQMADAGLTPSVRESALLDGVLDRTIEDAIGAYSAAQQRVLLALNQISEAAFDSDDVETLLQRLIDLFRQSAEGVDEVGIFLCDGDRLVLRASSGTATLSERLATSSSAIAAEAAASRRPVSITTHGGSGAGADPLVDELRSRQLKTVYAAPMLNGSDVVGVAQMASCSALDFSEEHRVLFRVMAQRATMMIDRARATAQDRAEAAVIRALASALTLDEAIAGLLTTIGELFAWDTGAFWRLDTAPPALRFDHGWNAQGGEFDAFWQDGADRTFPRGIGLPGQAWETGAVVWMADPSTDAAFQRRDTAAASNLQSAIAFPLAGEHGEPLGVLEFFTRRRRSAHEEGVYLTRVLARQLPEFMRRIAATERIQQSELRMSAMQATALDAIVWMDADGIVTAWNPAAERTFGYSADEAVGRKLSELMIPTAQREAHQRGLERYMRGGEARLLNRRIEVTAIDKTAREFPVELVITQFDAEGARQFVGFLRDISERKASEADRQRLLIEAQQATEMRDHLLAVVSHDLRNSLNAVVVSGALLQMSIARAPTEDRMASRTIETILRAASQMRQLIGDLLDVAVIQSGRLSVNLKVEDVCSIVSEAVDLHRPLAAEKSIRLETRAIPDNVLVMADRGRLMQVFSNLLGNAIKFNQSGDEVVVGSELNGDSICLSVCDTGPGIAEEALPLIFEPHWAGPVKEKGTGLGLFISRRLVEAHGGTLTVSRNPDRGVTFTFCLPIEAPGHRMQ